MNNYRWVNGRGWVPVNRAETYPARFTFRPLRIGEEGVQDEMEKDNGLPPRPTIVNVLGRDPEPLPEWLANDNPPRFNCDNFFGSRTVYYPGYGDDGQPVELCNRSHAAHTFIYVDHGVGQDTLAQRLHDRRQGFLGYEVAHQEELSEDALRPGGWTQHVTADEAHGLGKVRMVCFGSTTGPRTMGQNASQSCSSAMVTTAPVLPGRRDSATVSRGHPGPRLRRQSRPLRTRQLQRIALDKASCQSKNPPRSGGACADTGRAGWHVGQDDFSCV